MASEWARIDLLTRVLGGALAERPGVYLGIGDDAAILDLRADGSGGEAAPLVWTIDAAVDGVHFRRDLLSFEDIGYRATMAAVSDLAAMGAEPLGVLAALVLPSALTDGELEALARGQREAADALGTAVIGGNLARGGELSITTTALGRAARPLTRGGARPGDGLFLAGDLGLAGAGLTLLLMQAPGSARDLDAENAFAASLSTAARAAVAAWRRPRARLEEGRAAARAGASAAIDVSDGLAQDVGHLARASGVRVVLDAAALVSPELSAVAAELGRDALTLALRGGEDYALVVALPAGQQAEGLLRIGACEASGEGAVGEVLLRWADGALEGVMAKGFDHFSG
jgi:thiamine-monophosphate kinase